MTDRARRGRTFIIAIITWFLLTDILTLILALAANGSQLVFALSLLVLEIVLFFFLYTGRRWARTAIGLLALLLGLFGWWIGFFIRNLNLAGILVFLCLGVFYLFAAALLFFSPEIREYLASRTPS